MDEPHLRPVPGIKAPRGTSLQPFPSLNPNLPKFSGKHCHTSSLLSMSNAQLPSPSISFKTTSTVPLHALHLANSPPPQHRFEYRQDDIMRNRPTARRPANRPTSSHSLPATNDHFNVNGNAKAWALPHSSGDTVPMDEDIQMRSEPVYPVNGHGAVDGSSQQMPIRSTPTPTPAPTAPPATSGSAGAAGDALEMLGCSVKVLLHAIRDLERHGIDAAASVPLPKIVVVGDQSAGKSSLIEAISEITVPRDSGTCTRCVLHINLRDEPHSDWRCEVSLVQKYYHAPDMTGLPLHPWAEMEQQDITPFTTVYDKKDLETAIRRAQLATLNPGRDSRAFAPSRHVVADVGIEVPFSPNIISLEIVAPGLPNLSFYDLPGVISQSHDGRKDTVHLIQELATSYIQQENTIILLTVPMESDIDNSMASALIDDIPGANDRTIGVLTKPDRLQADDKVDIWQSVLQGNKFKKGHGYFVVKQPSQSELDRGISHSTARNVEEDFFRSQEWAKRFGKINVAGRLGTRNLQKELSSKLAHLIVEVMPNLEMQVSRKLAEVEEELEGLPEPPPNALQVVNQAIVDFTRDVSYKVEASVPNDLSEAWKKIKTEFHNTVVAAQYPTLKVDYHEKEPDDDSTPVQTPAKVRPTSTKAKRGSEVINVSSDEEVPTPSKKQKGANGSVQKPVNVKREASVASTIPRDPLRKIFTLPELRMTLESFSTSGLPQEVELKAVDHMILTTLANWHVPLDLLVNKLHNSLSRSLKSSLDSRVGQWRTTRLYDELKAAIGRFLNDHVNLMRGFVHRSLSLERVKPITRNDKQMAIYKADELTLLTNARLKARYHHQVTKALEAADKDVILPPWDDKAKKAAEKLSADPFSREVDVMAKIRAYYQIASMRLVDEVVQAVEAELFMKFREDLFQDLANALQVYGENGFANANRLVADDPDREEKRALLKERRSRLLQAGERISAMHHDFFQQNGIKMDFEV